ncbi:MAG: ribokinase [Lachnospiraceae bacterium]|nr:ribokinase [Lachnospiraceae bacterium]
MERSRKKGKVAVIGLAGQSAFMAADHFPAPGETIACSSLFFELGGKGYNQAIACARMGVKTVFIGAVGDDTNGVECKTELEKEGITACLVKKTEPTAYAVITTRADSENTVSVYSGAAKKLSGEDLQREEIRKEIADCEYLLLQNELSTECLEASFALASQLHIPVIFNPAPADHIPPELFAGCEVITPNYGEAKVLAGFAESEEPSEQDFLEALRKLGVKQAVITMGCKGALLIDGGKASMIPAVSCGTAIDTTGAGDTFNGTLTAALALGKRLEEAAKLAAIAAGISVTRRGAAGSIPTADELNAYL